MSQLESFRAAGRTLFSFGLVQGAEGNLSTFDGEMLVITRTGAELHALQPDDLIEGRLAGPLPGASSDVGVHRERYVADGPGAIAHAHPTGTVPEGALESGRHGVYVHAGTLDDAVREAVRLARAHQVVKG